MSGRDTILEDYGEDLDDLKQGDTVGVMWTDNNALHFFVNGKDQGAAKYDVKGPVWGIVDVYANCVQVTTIGHADDGSSKDTKSFLQNMVVLGVFNSPQNERICQHLYVSKNDVLFS